MVKEIKKYQDGINQGYQPYWVLYCLRNGLEFDHKTLTMVNFINWIMGKHREFEPEEKNRCRTLYAKDFLDWLKEC